MKDIPDVLAHIAAYKVDEVAAIKADPHAQDHADAPPPRGFLQRIATADAPALICEVKKASPSKGVIREDFDAPAIARAYAAGGAACLSVLTDAPGFQGSFDIFNSVRAATDLPLLCKDFFMDPAQVHQARRHGADAILVILAMTDDATSRELIETANAVGMDALVETHTEDEVRRAVDLGATLIGINNRDLHTFDTSLDTFEQLAPLVPPHVPLVAESGIFTRADVERMSVAGARAFLIGESLMRQDDVEAATRALRG